MATTFDRQCMARALELARKGWYSTRPNPRVGCVIARNGSIVGEGYHHRAGEAHAEINALADAGDRARGASAYVSLEPCNHRGRTGPCSEALIAAGIGEVVFGMADPNALADGGIERLRQAGIDVRGPLLETEAQALNPGFIKRCRTGLPRVTVKIATSLDGRTAMASGESQWITGAAARRDVQRLRAASDAIVTGIGTVLQDDPSLNVRAEELDLPEADAIAGQQPLRVVVDSAGRLPATAKLLTLGGAILQVSAQPAPALQGVENQVLSGGTGEVDLAALLLELGRRGYNEVLVEAGARLAGAFVAAGLADRLVVYMAARLLGSEARPLLTLPLDTMAAAVDLTITDIRAIGNDWRILCEPRNTPLQNTESEKD